MLGKAGDSETMKQQEGLGWAALALWEVKENKGSWGQVQGVSPGGADTACSPGYKSNGNS